MRLTAPIDSIAKWFDARLQVASTIRETAEHAVPRETSSWFYVFGSAAFVVFMLQIVTGILLALRKRKLGSYVGCEWLQRGQASRQACCPAVGGAIRCSGDLISFMVRWESSLSTPGTSPSWVETNVS